MATDPDFPKFVADQIDAKCDVSYRKMFGEYVLYSKAKVVALICDNQLFMKPTEAGRAFIGDVVEAPPYPGKNPFFLIQELMTQSLPVGTLEALQEPVGKCQESKE